MPGWEGPRRKELRSKIAKAVPNDRCSVCEALFEGTETVCWLSMVAAGLMNELDEPEALNYMANCKNPHIVELVKKYRAGT